LKLPVRDGSIASKSFLPSVSRPSTLLNRSLVSSLPTPEGAGQYLEDLRRFPALPDQRAARVGSRASGGAWIPEVRNTA
jgi:hypothetical protein